MADRDEHTLLLGEIKGKLDLVISGQERQDEKMGSIDDRLRRVETKAALNGAAAGGVVGLGIALAQAKLKALLGIDMGDGA